MKVASNYFEARDRFRECVSRIGWILESYPISAKGPKGEDLSIDVGYSPEQSPNTLIITSGLHGVEGFFGSAIQNSFLDNKNLLNQLKPRVVLIHALNPFGFAWLRRANEDNIDLNRNFLLSDDSYKGAPSTYSDLDDFLNPTEPPSSDQIYFLKAIWIITKLGMPAFKQAVAEGQFEFPKGLFYGGNAPSMTVQILQKHMRNWIGNSSKVLHLDFHTGLGRWMAYKLLIDYPLDSDHKQWLSNFFPAKALEETNAKGVAYSVRGSIGKWCITNFSDVDYTYLCAEFGTYSPLKVLKSLREENQAYHWGQSTDVKLHYSNKLKEVFCPNSLSWRNQTLIKSLNLIESAIKAINAK